MDVDKLQKLGLNRNESKIYFALLELKESQAGELSKRTQINRTTTYDSLDRLIEKGLVTYVVSANKKVFHPVSPKRILESIKEKEKIANEVLPSLINIFEKSKKEEEAEIYKGKKGIKTILNEILKYKEYVAFGSSGKFFEIMEHDFEIFQKMKKKLGIKSRVIQSEFARKDKKLKRIAFAKFKYIANEFSTPSTSIIYGDKIAIIVWAEIPIATVITSKQVSKSYKNYFELLWKQAKN